MAIVFCHKERGISVEEENHLVTVGIVKKSKTILVLLASPIDLTREEAKQYYCKGPEDQYESLGIQFFTLDEIVNGIVVATHSLHE